MSRSSQTTSPPNTKEEYLFIIQGDMTPFQRATLAKMLYKKAIQLDCGLACNWNGEELSWYEMIDNKNHPEGE